MSTKTQVDRVDTLFKDEGIGGIVVKGLASCSGCVMNGAESGGDDFAGGERPGRITGSGITVGPGSEGRTMSTRGG